MLERFRKPKVVIIDKVLYPEDFTEFLVPMKTLREVAKNKVYETPRESFVIIEDHVYRSLKADAKPVILKTDSLHLHANYGKVKAQVSQETIFQFANENSLTLFETPDSFVLPSERMMLIAKKEKEKEAEEVK